MTPDAPRPAASPAPLPVLDEVDHAVLRVLHRDPRAGFAEVAAAAGVHERTVARRLERMTATGHVRFTAALVPEYLGEGITAELAVRCAPGRVHETALALARRPETRSVEVATGALEVFAEFNTPDHQTLLTLIDSVVGRMDGVVDIHSGVVMRLLLTAADWAPYDDEPTRTRRLVMAGRGPRAPLAVDELDRGLVALLHRDARMSTTRLARELRVGESTARRRLARLMTSHVLHLRLHADPAVLGYPVEARFRIGTAHSRLGAAIRLLAREPAVRHLVVTTGTTALLGYSSHRDLADLHAFTSRVFGHLDGVTSTDTALLMRTYKRAGVTEPAAAPEGGTSFLPHD
ncbi:Lrp/AsnC family transcriptional regulator [Streptomyces subrutilus]|uniref:AsnC family transcriptional regulator n=1 Tax=Streptomyces subrutilus TaxID=36818 RepID=A0A5P2UW50_9ACTN|nr:Lrp/AsnC family transcriptional regulator [Streptomyces subrutilus]QEU81751.1 Lrp/AsnC family transcriptional regulator [Streptomyces subrutilus]WSJ28819.1 Lrp/AsnC family transcriptional regulator [Streptomyces subrutilus]GGZ93338.1 AsnC family transcriptional regulator [Streptomyces subrutilus]